MRRALYVGILVLVALSFVTSFAGGAAGAYRLGYHDLSWTPPIILDVVALLAVLVHWRVVDDRSMRRLAAGFVIVPMLLSWGMQAIAHVAVSAEWQPFVVLYAGIGAVGVAALLWFAQRYADYERRGTLGGAGGASAAFALTTSAVAIAPTHEAPPAPPELESTPDVAEPELSLEQAAAAGWPRRELIDTFKITDYAARQARAKARNGSAA